MAQSLRVPTPAGGEKESLPICNIVSIGLLCSVTAWWHGWGGKRTLAQVQSSQKVQVGRCVRTTGRPTPASSQLPGAPRGNISPGTFRECDDEVMGSAIVADVLEAEASSACIHARSTSSLSNLCLAGGM